MQPRKVSNNIIEWYLKVLSNKEVMEHTERLTLIPCQEPTDESVSWSDQTVVHNCT